MRIALPKGRLLPQLLKLFEERGIRFAFAGDRDYRPKCNIAGLEAKLIKARVIPQMLALGNFQMGFTCLDAVSEAGIDGVVPLASLGLNPVRIVAAVHESKLDILENPPPRPLVIATEYPNLAGRWALGRNLAHVTVNTAGSTEAYPPEDADIVIDVVGTGASLKANGLVAVDEIMRSATCAVTTRAALNDPETFRQICRFMDLLTLEEGTC